MSLEPARPGYLATRIGHGVVVAIFGGFLGRCFSQDRAIVLGMLIGGGIGALLGEVKLTGRVLHVTVGALIGVVTGCVFGVPFGSFLIATYAISRKNHGPFVLLCSAGGLLIGAFQVRVNLHEFVIAVGLFALVFAVVSYFIPH
jgi:hypothetical protein